MTRGTAVFSPPKRQRPTSATPSSSTAGTPSPPSPKTDWLRHQYRVSDTDADPEKRPASVEFDNAVRDPTAEVGRTRYAEQVHIKQMAP